MTEKWTFLLLFCSVTFSSQYHKCVHDEIISNHVLHHKLNPVVVPQDHIIYALNSEQQITDPPPLFTQPLRIVVNFENLYDDPYTCYKDGDVHPYKTSNGTHTCRSDDILTETKRNTLVGLLKDASNFFFNILLVIPIDGNLKVQSGISAQIVCDEIRINPQFETIGVSNAEYVLFVTSRPTPSDTTLAYARYCQADNLGYQGAEGRPVVGIVNFAPYSIDLSPEGKDRQLGIVIHEITHALGFSQPKFQSGFIEWQWINNQWQKTEIKVNQIIKTYYHPQIGHQVTRIITNHTVNASRAHYGCPTLDGAELENGGGFGTALSHWEQRVFQNEYMTGTSSPYPVYSEITFSLLKDMGWYDVSNGSIAKLDPFLWGRNMSCSFVDGNCADWPLTSVVEGYRCAPESPRGQCRFDLKGWASCNVNLQDPLDDGCFFYKSTTRTGCNLDTKFFQLTMDAGESHDPTARCFHSSLAKFPSLLNNYLRIPQGSSMQCYSTTCVSPTELKLSVDGVWYDCPYEGGDIYPIDFGGGINCRPKSADVVCVNAKTDPSWPLITRIWPRTAKPGDTVTIYGTNFVQNVSRVKIYTDCTNVHVVSENQILAQLPGEEKFSSWSAFGLFFRRFAVIVSDGQGRNSHLKEAIQIDVRVNGASVNNWFADFGISRAWPIVISIILLLVAITASVFWCYTRCKKAETKQYYRSVKL